MLLIMARTVPSAHAPLCTVMGRLQYFTERLLFIHKCKGTSVVHICSKNMVISWDWVPLPRKMSLLPIKKGPVVAGVELCRGTFNF